MKINGIFTLVPGSLYSAQFAGESDHAFVNVFKLWRDAAYLDAFFAEHDEDLLSFWEYMSIQEAIDITEREAARLESQILACARKGAHGGLDNLSAMFIPLHARPMSGGDLEKCKARGFRRQSWLRIYAVRIDVNMFVVSGGAIKLTRTMHERAHLFQELVKLEKVCQFLREDQKNEFGLFELF